MAQRPREGEPGTCDQGCGKGTANASHHGAEEHEQQGSRRQCPTRPVGGLDLRHLYSQCGYLLWTGDGVAEAFVQINPFFASKLLASLIKGHAKLLLPNAQN